MCKRHISFKAETIVVRYQDLLLTFELVCNECKSTLEQHQFCWMFSPTTDVEKFTRWTSIFTGLKKLPFLARLLNSKCHLVSVSLTLCWTHYLYLQCIHWMFILFVCFVVFAYLLSLCVSFKALKKAMLQIGDTEVHVPSLQVFIVCFGPPDWRPWMPITDLRSVHSVFWASWLEAVNANHRPQMFRQSVYSHLSICLL